MANQTTFTELKNRLEGEARNGFLIINKDNCVSERFTQFLATLPGRQINLSNVRVTLDETADTLLISGSSNEVWFIKGTADKSLSISHVAIVYFYKNQKIESKLSLEGDLTIGQSAIAITGELDDQGQINCQAKQIQTESTVGLIEVSNFISRNQLAGYLPNEVDLFTGKVPMTAFNFSFGFSASAVTRFMFTSDFNVSWKLIEKIAELEKVGITLTSQYGFNSRAGFQSSFGGNIHAYLVIGQEYKVSLALRGRYNWQISLIPADGNILPGLSSLAELAGGEDLRKSVDSGMKALGLGAISIDGVNLRVDLKPAALRSIEIIGHITLEQITFNIQAYLPHFEFNGGLSPKTPIHLKELIGKYFVYSDTFPAVDITRLNLSVRPEIGQYTLYASIHSEWTLKIGKVDLIFKEFDLEITKQKNGIIGSINGVFELAGVELDASAEHLEIGGGWHFYSSTENNKEIPIGEFIGQFIHLFGEINIPATIEGLKVKNFSVSFNTESKDFTFTCEGILPLPDTDMVLDAVIDIEIKHQHDNEQESAYTKRFSGYLDINGLHFALVFEDSVGTGNVVTKTFIAAFNDQEDRKIELDELLKKVFPPSALSTDKPVNTGLSIGIKDAVIAFENKKGNDKNPVSNYLLGIDIETGLNLSALDLPDLPLVKNLLPPGQSLKLALQLFYAKSQFIIEDVDHFNSLMTQGLKLPHKEINGGLGLVALLRVGQDVKPLSLPIGVDSKEGKGLVDASGKSQPGIVDANSPGTSADVSTADNTQWIKIQKTFGPIHLERVGVGYQNSNIECLLDASLTAAGLTLSLDGLGAEFALTDIAKKELKPSFHLDGMGIDFKNGSLEIGGTFLKQTITPATVSGEPAAAPYTSYAGLAIIRTAKLSLSAIGSYMQLSGRDPSLFVYAVANYPLGGPPFFFVTGFAAGFGYNRALTLPPIDKVASFPLVAEAVQDGGPKCLPTDKKGQQSALSSKLTQLENYLPPASGEIFIAAGVKFNSFKQIDSFALLILKFGRHFEIDLLGFSTLTAPPPKVGKDATAPPDKNKAVAPLAQAQLVLKASFVPDEGLLTVRAQLTPNSYIFSKDCQLSGGFAFYSWFDPHPNAGDFVLTLGGYHPKFVAPQHYPQVPRLAVNWQVSTELHVKADAYFALTGSALMAGGHLQAVYQHDKLKAWFNAGADFIVAWQPYHYDAEIYIDVGVSYTFEIFGNHTLSVDLGADLHLWGPEFCGQATVHWSIISFTVRFGEDAPQALDPIKWEDFKTAFLPKPEQICTIGVQHGLVRQMQAEKREDERWIVNAKEMVLAVHSVIPITGGPLTVNPDQLGKAVTIASMGIDESNPAITMMSINVTRDKCADNLGNDLMLSPILKAMPAGLWGKPNFTDNRKHLRKPNVNGEQLVENMLVGFEIRPLKKETQPADSYEIDRDVQQGEPKLVQINFKWNDFKVSGKCGEVAWKAAETAFSKHEERLKLCEALGLINTVIDFGEPVIQPFSSAT